MPFVPLRVFSCFTMLEGAIDPKAIAKLAKERGFPADRHLRPQRALRRRWPFGDACKARRRAADHRRAAGAWRGRTIGPAGTLDWLALLAAGRGGL